MGEFLKFEERLSNEHHAKSHMIGTEVDTHITGEDYKIRITGTGYEMIESNPGLLTAVLENQVETVYLGRGSEAEAGYFYAHSVHGQRRFILRRVFDPNGLPSTATHTAYLLLAAGGIKTVTPCLAMTAESGENFNIYLCGDPIYQTAGDYLASLWRNGGTEQTTTRDEIEKRMRRTQRFANRILHPIRAARILGTLNYQVDLYEGWLGPDQKGLKYDNYLVCSEEPLDLMVIDPLKKRFQKETLD